MKKNLLVLLAFVLAGSFVNAQAADPSSNSTAISDATAGAVAVGGNNSASQNVGVQASNGNMTMQGGDTNITFEASKAVAPVIAGPQVSGSVPQNFGPSSATVNGKGVDLTLFYNQVCKPKVVRGYDLSSRTYKGASGKTKIVVTPHLNYVKAVTRSPRLPWEEIGASSKGTITVEEVEPVEFGTRGKFKCLELMQISGTDEEAADAAMQTILSDAQIFPLQHMEGFPTITLLSDVSTIAMPTGNSNTGSGYGGTTGLGRIIEPVTTAVGFTAAASSGVTFPEQKLGMTIIVAVRVADNDPDGVFIDFSPKQAEQAGPVSQSTGKPVVAENKAGGPQETAVVHNKSVPKTVQKKKMAVQKNVAKQSASQQAMLAASPQKKEPSGNTVIKCADCIFRGELLVKQK